MSHNRRTSKIGAGFMLTQVLDEKNPSAGVMIIHCGAALLPPGDYSPVEDESIALDRAVIACDHWIYHNPYSIFCFIYIFFCFVLFNVVLLFIV